MQILIAFGILIALGLTLILVKRREKRMVFTGVAIVTLPFVLLAAPSQGQIFLAEIDKSRGHHLELSAHSDSYEVTLMSMASRGHYNSIMKVRRADGQVGYHFLNDSHRWWNGRVEWQDGKAYFLGGHVSDGQANPYFDPEAGVLCGFNQKPVSLESMHFSEPIL